MYSGLYWRVHSMIEVYHLSDSLFSNDRLTGTCSRNYIAGEAVAFRIL